MLLNIPFEEICIFEIPNRLSMMDSGTSRMSLRKWW